MIIYLFIYLIGSLVDRTTEAKQNSRAARTKFFVSGKIDHSPYSQYDEGKKSGVIYCIAFFAIFDIRHITVD